MVGRIRDFSDIPSLHCWSLPSDIHQCRLVGDLYNPVFAPNSPLWAARYSSSIGTDGVSTPFGRTPIPAPFRG